MGSARHNWPLVAPIGPACLASHDTGFQGELNLMRDHLALFFTRHEPTRGHIEHLKSALGAVAAILLIGALAQMTALPLLVAPLAATSVIVFGYPGGTLAQPINVFGSYLITTIIGCAAALFAPDMWWVAAPATGLAIFLMQSLRITHPPAGAIPVLAIAMHEKSLFLFVTLLVGSIGILTIALVVHALPPRRRYPAPKPGVPVQTPVSEQPAVTG